MAVSRIQVWVQAENRTHSQNFSCMQCPNRLSWLEQLLLWFWSQLILYPIATRLFLEVQNQEVHIVPLSNVPPLPKSMFTGHNLSSLTLIRLRSQKSTDFFCCGRNLTTTFQLLLAHLFRRWFAKKNNTKRKRMTFIESQLHKESSGISPTKSSRYCIVKSVTRFQTCLLSDDRL